MTLSTPTLRVQLYMTSTPHQQTRSGHLPSGRLSSDCHSLLCNRIVQNEQVVLLLDGLDYMPNRSEDPLDWLPLSLQPNVRIIGTALPIGRVVYACDGTTRF